MSRVLSSLPVGARVVDPGTVYNNAPLVWLVADIGYTGYPDGSVTLISEILPGIRIFDALELEGSMYPNNGNPKYELSNIRQWLNKEGLPWYVTQHIADKPPSYADTAGFLTNFSAMLKAAIIDTTIGVMSYGAIDKEECKVTDKVFFLSRTETDALQLFSGKGNNGKICNNSAGKASVWWLRDRYPNYHVYIVSNSGSINYNSAAQSYYFRPAFNVAGGSFVADEPDGGGVYSFVWEEPVVRGAAFLPFSLRPL